jgi:hypothetical protein
LSLIYLFIYLLIIVSTFGSEEETFKIEYCMEYEMRRCVILEWYQIIRCIQK